MYYQRAPKRLSTEEIVQKRKYLDEMLQALPSKVTSFKLQTFSVLLYCYVMDKSGKILLLHLFIRTSHKLLTLLKIFTRIYSILHKQVNDLQSTLQKKQLKISELQQPNG